jgi:hypothetical protein
MGGELGLVGADARAGDGGARSLEKKGGERGIVVESGSWSEGEASSCLALGCFALALFGVSSVVPSRVGAVVRCGVDWGRARRMIATPPPTPSCLSFSSFSTTLTISGVFRL